MDEGRCARHQFEAAQDMCRHCGDLFCNECLVYSFGANKPPYCVSCALAAAGVRSNGAAPRKLSRKERKRRIAQLEQIRKERESYDSAAESLSIDWDSDEVEWQPIKSS